MESGQGRAEDLKDPDAVILDEIYKQKLGVTHVGEIFEIGAIAPASSVLPAAFVVHHLALRFLDFQECAGFHRHARRPDYYIW